MRFAGQLVAACATAVLFGAACHPPGDDEQEADAGLVPPGVDGAPAPTTTDEVLGSWRFVLGDPGAPALHCDIEILPGAWQLACPTDGLPVNVGDGCDLVAEAILVHGTLTDQLGGQVEAQREYAGPGCAALSYPAGLPIVVPLADLSATRQNADGGDGFWSAVHGSWAFAVTDVGDPMARGACTVTLAATAWSIECPTSEPMPVAPYCEQTRALGMDGTVGLMGVAGSLYEIVRNVGPGCGPMYPPMEQSEAIPLTVKRTSP